MRKLYILATGLILFATTRFTTALAQTKVTSATFGMMEARWLGPGTMSGRITAIEGVNEDGKTLYVGSAGGGVWKTTNAGASFIPVFDKYCQSIGSIAIDQKNPGTVYVGTGESNMRNSVSIGDGLYKSRDGGDNWTRIGLDSTEHIAKIVIDPQNSNTIYVAAPGPLWCDSKHRGLFKSVDGGKTWDKILYIDEKSGCADVSLDPSNPLIVYATTWEFRRLPYSFNSGGQGSGVYKSMDGGKSWKELTNGLPSKPFGRVAFALAPSAPNNLLAIVESKETGLYISQDGGEHWKQQSATSNIVARPFYFSVIKVDPFDAKRVYRPAFTFAYSDDGGFSFSDAGNDGGWVHSDEHALWINPKNTSQLYLGTDGGVYLSLDRGATWLFLQNLPVGQFYHVAVDKQVPYRIYGGLQDNGSWMAPSSAPGGVKNSNWQTIYGGDGFWAQPDPEDADVAYAESQGGSAGRIDLKTMKTVTIQPQAGSGEEKLRWNWNTPIVTGAHNGRNLYMGAQYLYRSTDQGSNWSRISPDLTTNDKRKQGQENSGGLSADNTSAENHCTIFTIAESPLDENTIWAGTDDGNLQLTSNAGKDWTNLSNNYAKAGIPSQAWISSIEPSLFDSNLVYITLDNHMYGDHKTWLARSTDKGRSWTLLTSPEFTGYAHKIKEDLVNRDLLFLGTEMGLFATVDGGKNWFRMKNHIPDYTLVRDIKIHPVTNDLILATHGRGIIVVDDISAMRSLTQDIIAKDVHLFESKPFVLTNGKYGTPDFPGGGTWNGGNPASVQALTYYLKDRISSEDVKLDIYDDSGKLVKTLPGSKRKGINKVNWDLRMTAPKVAGGGTKADFSSLVAPMVLPGRYTVKLKLGNKEYTQAVTLVADSTNSHFSLKDRRQQYATAMQLYRMHEHLSETVEDISKNQKILTDNTGKLKSSKGKKLLEEYNGKLEELRGTLLATRQKSIFADEERLRERISEVYVAVCMQEAPPSNLQMQRVEVLQQELEVADRSNALLKSKYDEKIKKELIREGLIKESKSSLQPGVGK
jgi:photosystem II stability/assembly factor-like uncharacterized protein